MDKTSNFMTDHSLGDKGKEAVMDFQVSWVLRMAANDEYTKDKPAFHLFCKYMLYKLLGMEFPNPKKIVKVKVWKEWENCTPKTMIIHPNRSHSRKRGMAATVP